MIKSAGYFTILETDWRKYELSVGENFLRIKCIDAYGKIKGSYLCERVTDPERIRSLERRSENWLVRGKWSGYDYYILEQRNADNKALGVCKIVKKADAKVSRFILDKEVVAPEWAWLYFERRR